MIIDRIRQIIDYKQISDRAFCREIGVGNGFLTKVKDVGVQKLNKILYKYPEINPVWLLTGEGSMLAANELSKKSSEKYFIGPDIVKDVDERMSYGDNDISALRLKILELEAKLEMLSKFNDKLLNKLGEKSGN